MKAVAIIAVVLATSSVSRAQNQSATNCTVPTTVTIPNLFNLQECLSRNNSDLQDALNAFNKSALNQDGNFPKNADLVDYFPQTNGVLNLTGLTNCKTGNDGTRLTRALLVLTKVVLCINVQTLTTPVGWIQLSTQLAALLFFTTSNLGLGPNLLSQLNGILPGGLTGTLTSVLGLLGGGGTGGLLGGVLSIG